jgi:hypothetical protein
MDVVASPPGRRPLLAGVVTSGQITAEEESRGHHHAPVFIG